MNKVFSIILLLLSGMLLQAQDITVTASAPNVVAVGEQFRLSFIVNEKADNLTPPDLKDFYILMGPSTSYNQSTQIINGKMTRSVTYTYTWILEATKEGVFHIDPATITVKNKTYTSNPLDIEVVKGSGSAGTGEDKETTGGAAPAAGENDLFLRIHVDKNSIYRGEHIIATVKIYSRVNLSGFENATFPSFNGFLREDIETPALRSLERENVNGVIYGTGVLQRFILFPQVTGELMVDPMELECLVQKRVQQSSRGFFDSFFDSYQNVKQTIKSPPVTVTVKELPEDAPESFSGSVGQLAMNVSVDKNQMEENEAMNLRIRFTGNGNIRLIEAPQVDFPPDFDLYDPKISSNVNHTQNGTSGSKTFEFLAIPRHAGDYRIPPIEFTYFDPVGKQYKSLRSDEFRILVKQSDESEGGAVISGFSKEDLRFIGSDIRFIKNEKFKLRPRDRSLIKSWYFYLSYLIALFLFGLIIILRRNHIKRNADYDLVRNRKARKIARKRLKRASSFLKAGSLNEFYEELLKALWGYLSDKLGIPLSDLSKENARSALEKTKITPEMISAFFEIIDRCEFARFAPSEEIAETEPVYEKASKVMSLFEQKLR